MKTRFGFFKAATLVLGLALILIWPAGCGLFGGRGRLGPAAAQEARRHLGVPYKPGGVDPRGFDCSGLTFYVYNRLGLELPRSSADQATVGRKIRRNHLRAGDLVFFSTGRGKTVIISELDSDYYSRNYHSARRVS